MKTKSIILFSIIFSAFTQSIFSQQKVTYWVHGMGGDAGSLNTMAMHFANIYNITWHPTNYRTDLGIVGSAGQLKLQIDSTTTSPIILIAHSMGGPNSVEVWRTSPKRVGGLITLASPMNGAYIANNIDNGIMTNLSKEVIDKGMKGIMTEPSYVASFITTAPWMGVITALCGKQILTLKDFFIFMSENFLSKAAESATQSAATKNSLKVGSTEIKNIQNSGFNRPSIAFCGSEDSPALLRFVGSKKNIDVVGLISNVYSSCNSKYEAHNILKYLAAASLNFPAAAAHNALSNAWKTSADYWSGGFQQGTDVFIGAYRIEKYWITYTDMECPPPLNEKSTQASLTCTNPVMVKKQKLITEIITEPNDGIVPFNSQHYLPGCLKVVELTGINHEEMKTHVDVRTQLEKVFTGETKTTRDPSFFILSKR